jgi:hypothetical protein
MKKIILAVLATAFLAASMPALAKHNQRHCAHHPNSPDCRP